jgi:PhnB protein
MTRPIPDGYHSVTPYLIVDQAAEALVFYQKAFGAHEIMRLEAPGGKIGHAEIEIGDSRIMLADEFPEMNIKSAKSVGGSPVSIHLYVEDADRRFDQAVKAGATVERAVEDQFYGDRSGTLKDPFGHRWHISTHKEDVAPEEIHRRMQAMMSGKHKAQ